MYNHLQNLVKRLVLVTAALFSTSGLTAEPKILWQIDQLDQPESVVQDPNEGYLYISNINGQPMEMNGQGYISRVTEKGQMMERHWINGMDAPKGMAIFAGLLYVADMQTLHVIDLKSSSVVKKYSAKKAKMLNDVTITDKGIVYVSDLIGGGVYRLQNSKFELWLDHKKLPHSNGLLWHQGELLVANWGEGMQGDFTTLVPGTLYKVNQQSRQLTTHATGFQLGNLDGIVADKNNLYISDWITGDLYRLGNNERHKIKKLPAGLADIGGSGKGILYAPLMMDNKVLALKL